MSSPRYRLDASRAHGHGTMSVALVTVPVARHSNTPTLAEWHEPRSSALMMTSLASAPYPRRWARLGSAIAAPPGHLVVLRRGLVRDLQLEHRHLGGQVRVGDGEDAHGHQPGVACPVHGH